MSYSGASRSFEKKTFSPTQSLKRLTSSSNGRTTLPPSHPHPATSEAVPAPAASRRNARRSIMAGEPAAIPAGDHGSERRRVHDEHQYYVYDEKPRENPHRPKVPIARRLKSSEQRSEPRELRGLVDRKSGDDRQHAEQDDEGVGGLLEGVVFSLRRVLLAQSQIVFLHLDRATDIARPEQERAPFAARRQVRQIQHAAGDERPHQREVPIQPAREPAAQPAPLRKVMILECIHVVRTTALAEARVRTVDLQPAHDHAGKQHERHPMREPND